MLSWQEESKTLPLFWSIPLPPPSPRDLGLGLPHQQVMLEPKIKIKKNLKKKNPHVSKENSRLSFPSWRVGDGCFVITPGLLLKTSWSDFYQCLNRNSLEGLSLGRLGGCLVQHETLLPSQLRCILSDTDLVSGWGPASLVFHGRAGWPLSGPGKTISCWVMVTVGCKHMVDSCL